MNSPKTKSKPLSKKDTTPKKKASRSKETAAKPRKKKLKTREFVWAEEPWMSELLVALSDSIGRQDKSILKAFAAFEEAAKNFVATVREAEQRADFWETAILNAS